MKQQTNNTAPDRTLQPQVTIPENLEVAMAEETRLANGARMYVLPDAGRDVVRFSFVFNAGTSWQTVPFSASATVNTLSEGSAAMNSLRIAEELDFYGSYFDVNIDRDYSVVTFVCLARYFNRTLEIAREILLRPEFPEAEVRVYCEKSRQSLRINRQKVDFLAREQFARSLYGAGHPYGVFSPAEGYDSLRAEDLREFYAKHYTGHRCIVVMSGDTTPERRRALADFASELPAGSVPDDRVFPEIRSESKVFVPHAGAVQSALRVGRVMFPRTHADYIPMQIVTAVLGGYFGSRLVQNLREERGYTYGAFAGMVNFDHSGYMAIGTEVGAAVTEDAVRQIFHEMERLRTETVPEAELALVKNIMVGEVMRILDGPFGIADITIENVQNGVDNSYLNDFVHKVKAITPADVRAAAEKYLVPEEFSTVIVGDTATV